MAPTQYLHLRQGQGDKFEVPFHNATTPTNKIGTHGCRTCVCVYIPISDSSCFAAHIDAHVSLPAHQAETGWIPTPEQGTALKTFMIRILNDRLPDFAVGGKNYKHPLRDSAVVICPKRKLFLKGGAEVRATGSYVVEALNEFFLLKGQGTDDVTDTAHGFVVDHASNKVDYLRFVDAGEDALYRLRQLASLTSPTEGECTELDALRARCQERGPGESGFQDVKTDMERTWSFFWDKDRGWDMKNVALDF